MIQPYSGISYWVYKFNKAHICTYALINLFINFIPKAGRWTLFSLLKKFQVVYWLLPNAGWTFRASFRGFDESVCTWMPLSSSEFVGGGITPNEVLKNYIQYFLEFWKYEETFIIGKMSHDDVLMPKIRHGGVL